jgi:prepilin-type N-terminal cleavage/methylation domain-containing protein
MINYKYIKKTDSFTLIELLTVIAVIGLLSSIVLVSIKSAREDAVLKKTMAFSASIQHALGSSAIGTWSFEDNLNDSSGNGNTGTWVGAGSPPYVEGIINKALQFNGFNYVRVINVPNNKTGAVTLEFWVYPDNFDNRQYLILNYSTIGMTPVKYYCYLISPKTIACLMHANDGSTASFVSDNILETKKWFHIVLTYDGKNTNSAKMFINSRELAPVSNNLSSVVYGGEQLFIGVYNITGFPTYLFKGLIDEVRIYDSYITLSEVQKHYAEGFLKRGLTKE